MSHLKKGSIVHIRRRNGSFSPQKYQIRSLGTKQAIVDRYDPEASVSYRRRGTTYHLATPSQIARYTSSGMSVPDYLHRHWGELFVLAGDEGWDPVEN
jgi:hypothetical protein